MNEMSNTSVYSIEDNYQQVNAAPDYHTLQDYYKKTNCPYQSRPGQCLVRPVLITPTFGGSGYTNLQHNVPPGDNCSANYFTISNAYPAWPYSPCMKPLV